MENEAPHLKGNVYVEYASPDDAWRAWRALRLRWYGGRQIDAELIACGSWDTALCGASKRSQCTRGRQACNYLHLRPSLQTSLRVPLTPSAEEKKHRDIVQYFENATATTNPFHVARLSASSTPTLTPESTTEPRTCRSESRDKPTRSSREHKSSTRDRDARRSPSPKRTTKRRSRSLERRPESSKKRAASASRSRSRDRKARHVHRESREHRRR